MPLSETKAAVTTIFTENRRKAPSFSYGDIRRIDLKTYESLNLKLS